MRTRVNGDKHSLILFCITLVGAALYLNLDIVQFEPLALWARILPPILLVFGLIGSVFEIKLLRAIGWIGLAVFLLVSLMVSFPSEDYILGGPESNRANFPRDVSTMQISLRLATGVVITILLTWFYHGIGHGGDRL